MKKRTYLTPIFLLGILILAACSNAQPESAASEPAPAAMAETTSEEAEEPVEEMAEPPQSEAAPAADAGEREAAAVPSESESESEAEAEAVPAEAQADAMPVELPAWQTLPLADARSGEPFTFADFAGKTVFVEPMATWCGNCRRQLGNVQAAHAQLGDDDTVFVALSVETTIAPETLAQYADDAGFDWTFAVMTPEMLQELSGAFGQTVSNPPATPHFLILPDGSTTELVTGIEPSADIIAQIEATQG